MGGALLSLSLSHLLIIFAPPHPRDFRVARAPGRNQQAVSPQRRWATALLRGFLLAETCRRRLNAACGFLGLRVDALLLRDLSVI